MRNKIIFFGVLSLFVLGSLYSDSKIKNTDFVLVSGNQKTYDLSDSANKITVCFYETRETSDVNRELKDRLNILYAETKAAKGKIFVLAVADCTPSFGLVKRLWEKGLLKKEEEEGYTVYGDWDGKMKESFDFIKDQSNLVIFDQSLNIVYKTYGKVEEEEIKRIEHLLVDLVSR